ncbi:MAG: two-component system, NtrC family, sensor histidine kinase GlrK [Pseudomonadota bacterium]|jgi:two-component system sensor histidine kinase GlrK|nr:two-component system, NtrC family, sensor histidine kinase GlrK [Pseudomonadota bacterium]
MRLRYPRSFIHLIVLGFALVCLPLALALFTSAVSMQKLADQSKRAVYQSVHYARASRSLAEEMTRMERHLRQYAVLGDVELLLAYQAAHQSVRSVLTDLLAAPHESTLVAALRDFSDREQQIYAKLSVRHLEPEEVDQIADELGGLSRVVDRLLAHGDILTEREVANTQQMAAHARDVVIRQLWLLLPVGLAVIWGFVLMTSRPIRQIEQAIEAMGQGDFASRVEIEGPGDLRRLGFRLEWLREQLRQVEDQKTRFLQQVSHDLKTPLAALREGADLLVDGSVGSLSVAQQEVAQILQHNSVRLQRQIEGLLQFSALQAQATSVVMSLTPLRPLVKKVLAAQQLPLLSKNISIELACPNLIVETDAEKLRVILDNLLSNAIRYAPQRSVVKLTLAQQEATLLLDVLDEGPGIAPEERKRIFERFYHGSASAEQRVKSSGLGLAIVAEFVRALRGSIVVLENQPGAHFRVSLPILHWSQER